MIAADRALLAASVGFAGAAMHGSVVSIRHNAPGQPLGITIPVTVPAGLLVGWGAGVAAPWPMPVAALIAAVSSRRAQPSAVPGLLCAGIGVGCIAGTLVEPVTRGPRPWPPAIRSAITMNLAASAALIAVGLLHAAATAGHEPQV